MTEPTPNLDYEQRALRDAQSQDALALVSALLSVSQGIELLVESVRDVGDEIRALRKGVTGDL